MNTFYSLEHRTRVPVEANISECGVCMGTAFTRGKGSKSFGMWLRGWASWRPLRLTIQWGLLLLPHKYSWRTGMPAKKTLVLRNLDSPSISVTHGILSVSSLWDYNMYFLQRILCSFYSVHLRTYLQRHLAGPLKFHWLSYLCAGLRLHKTIYCNADLHDG